MRFSNKEIKDLFFAWLIISLAFAILFSGIKNLLSSSFLISFIISAFTVGIGFLFHEIMHKYFAQKYGLKGEFHAFYGMLGFALLLSLFGFIIAAPGAVFIQGKITREKNGKISLAGPMTNIVLALLFLIFLLVFGIKGYFGILFYYGLSINSLLALFNLLPFMPFDGSKVLAWSKPAYFASVFLALILFFGRFFFSKLLVA